ncbi:MAG: IS701 family transposase [Chloroflexota bacterium]|nr:IS701 family transposase [Chloroflexota bacterium]
MVQDWMVELDELHGRISHHFSRSEPRRRALAYLKSITAPVERKNGWQLAEAAGERTPDGMQRLLNAANWDADAVRDDLREYVVEHLGDEEGVLIIDETSFLKKGNRSVGVQRQYSGTAGKKENCQVGVFLCYASEKGAAFVDWVLYLPNSWAENSKRRVEAGVPEDVGFETKPELATKMLQRTLDAGVPTAWVIGDSVYGSARKLRMFLEERRQPFVLAVTSTESVWAELGRGLEQIPAHRLLEGLDAADWRRLSAGSGSKGERLFDWVLVPLPRLQLTEEERRWGHWLLVRRTLKDPEDLAFYVVFAPREGTTLERLVRVAGRRWRIENCFSEAKGSFGLDEYEVRKWKAWHRHVTLSMLAHAFTEVVRSKETQKGAPQTMYPTISCR